MKSIDEIPKEKREEFVLSYIKQIFKSDKKTEQNIYCVFEYGNPKGSDIDLCIVCDSPEKLPKAPELIDLKAYDTENFLKTMAKHGAEAKEFRVIALENLFNNGQGNTIKYWPNRKNWLENIVRYHNLQTEVIDWK